MEDVCALNRIIPLLGRLVSQLEVESGSLFRIVPIWMHGTELLLFTSPAPIG